MIKTLLLILIGMLCGCQSPVLCITSIDGITQKPIPGVRVEYWGYSNSIFGRAPVNQHRILLGSTDSDGRLVAHDYPNRGVTELYLIKNGYAPAYVGWHSEEEGDASIGSPLVDDPEDVIGGQSERVDLRKPLRIKMFRYKPGVKPAPTRLKVRAPEGIEDPE